MESQHEFTLILDGIPDLTPAVMDALYEAGCDDALVARSNGVMTMSFARSGPSMKEAIASAIRDVRRSGIGARVVRIDEPSSSPDHSEAVANEVGALNSVLQLSAVIEVDPSLRPIVLELLQPTP
jgi:hypothetical protein